MRENLLAAAALAMAVPVNAQVEVILSEVGPTSDVGVPGRTISSMASFSLSPDGAWWAVELDLDGSGSTNHMHVRGQGAAIAGIIFQEGVTPLPSFPGVTGFFAENSASFEVSINNHGQVAGMAGNTISGEPTEFIYLFDGTSTSIVAGSGAAVPAIAGAFYGNEVHSPNMLSNGECAFYAENLTGISASMDEASLTSNGNVHAGLQNGLPLYPNGALENADQAGFYVTPDGSTFLYRGDTDAATDIDDVIIYGAVGTPGTAVLIEGTTTIAEGIYDDTFHASLAANGDWYVSGDLIDGTYIAVKNGSVLATEGGAAPNGFLYGDIPNIVGDSNGNYVWIWDTTDPDTSADEILVYNGTDLILAEGDTIEIDRGSGPENVIIDEFNAFDVALGDDGWVYLIVQLDDLNGSNIGDAFIRVRVGESCVGDIADDFGMVGADGMVSFGDFLALLGLVGPCPGGTPGCVGDIADDFGMIGADGMVSFGDFLALLGLVGPCS